MNKKIIKVGYPYVPDLYYRIQHYSLENNLYSLDFIDWIKAGIAYNVRGIHSTRRSISYFAQLYSGLYGIDRDISEPELRMGIVYFYEDLYLLCRDYSASYLQYSEKNSILNDFAIVPTFAESKSLVEKLDSQMIKLNEYKVMDKHRDSLLIDIRALISESSCLFKCMSLYYDYGIHREGNGMLLEVGFDD